MNLEELIKPIIPVIENINLLVYLVLFVRKWRFPKRTVALTLGAIILLFITPYSIWFSLKFGTEREIVDDFTLLSHAVLLAALLILGKMENGRLLFSLSVSYMLVYLCGLLEKPFIYGSYYFQCFVRLVFFAAFTWINYRYHRKYLFDAMNWINKGWYFLSVIPLAAIPHYMYAVDHEKVPLLSHLSCFQGLSTYVILLGTLFFIKKQQQARQENSLLYTHASAFRQFHDHIIDSTSQNRILRHDIRHYCMLLRNAIAAGDQEQALQILENLEIKCSAPESVPAEIADILGPNSFSGPPLIHALLSFYRQQASRCGISVKISVFMPMEPDFDLTEFSVLVSNSMENAIHACLKITNPEKRKIIVCGDMKQQQFFFEIKNTYCGKILFEDGIPVAEESGHGTGLLSICAFATKYGAVLDFDAAKEWFRLRLLI